MTQKKKGKRRSFFREFLKNGKMVGSISPSSKFLQKKMVAPIKFNEAKCIVEFGPGEGCITREIVKHLGPDTHLFLFEMHEEFVRDFLQFDNPNVHAINDSAEHLGKYLKEYGIDSADYVISSLPLTNFPMEVKENILNGVLEFLSKDGVYMQYQYTTSALKLLKSKFSKVKMGFAAINIPPAFVYTCYA